MKKLSIIALAFLLLLSGCAPNFQKKDEVVQTKEKAKEKAIIPKYKISDKYYQTLLPFKPGEARGLIVNNLNTRYDINEFEMGLMRIAQHSFDPDKYVFREGQELDRKTVKLWLNRKYTKDQLAKEGLKESQNIGLNPLNEGKGDLKNSLANHPIYLSHILEHDYMIKGDNDTVKLGGVTIGLALNSIYYYQPVPFGDTFEKKIPKDEMVREGRKIAEEVLKRLRAMKDLSDVPITIALFGQESRTSVIPGTFLEYTDVDSGSSSIDSWEKVDEKYYLFPSNQAMEDHRDDATAFLNFKQDVEEYFPNFNGVIGKAFYEGDQLQELNITIPIQFYGKAESIGFTQYVAGLVMEHFPKYISVSVNVTSVDGPEALIDRKADQNEPYVHIY
ncbi:CamS family sex pheromone protein [Neobacillus terrae]|uniref:CamS family sex pheromone protein n=1 Tax=Neobacillus terrae TaxID=3034837 RepID=UPI00140DF989|nr:CamS family sex pheromone protein [Neobacillus terrae]